MEGYKLTLLPKSVTDGNCYIGVVPSHVVRWNNNLGNMMSGWVYVAPKRNETTNKFLTLGINNRFSSTTKMRGPQKYIDFTDKFEELNDDDYEIRVFKGTAYKNSCRI